MESEKKSRKLLTVSIDDYIKAVYEDIDNSLDIDFCKEFDYWDDYAKNCLEFVKKFDFLLNLCRKKKNKKYLYSKRSKTTC